MLTNVVEGTKRKGILLNAKFHCSLNGLMLFSGCQVRLMAEEATEEDTVVVTPEVMEGVTEEVTEEDMAEDL